VACAGAAEERATSPAMKAAASVVRRRRCSAGMVAPWMGWTAGLGTAAPT